MDLRIFLCGSLLITVSWFAPLGQEAVSVEFTIRPTLDFQCVHEGITVGLQNDGYTINADTADVVRASRPATGAAAGVLQFLGRQVEQRMVVDFVPQSRLIQAHLGHATGDELEMLPVPSIRPLFTQILSTAAKQC